MLTKTGASTIKMMFLDTYCLVKLARDEDYLKDIKEEEACTLSVNLAELHYVLLKNYGSEVADHFAKLYSSITIPVPLDLISGAMKWRYENKKLKFSYADALGYQYALYNNMKFVTGDRAFKGVENVILER